MKNKKNSVKKVKPNNGVTTRTWIMFGIFLFISIICLKIISRANALANSIVIPAPVAVESTAKSKTITPVVHKVIKK